MAIPACLYGRANFNSLLLEELNSNYLNCLDGMFSDAFISDVEFLEVLEISESDSEITARVSISFTFGRQWNSCGDSYATQPKLETAQVKIQLNNSDDGFELDDFEIELISGESPPNGDYY